MISSVWFWTDIVSPHMISLFENLIQRGIDVRVMTEVGGPSEDRIELGWPKAYNRVPVTAVRTDQVKEFVADCPLSTVHICSGLDGYSMAGRARSWLAA